MANEEEGNQITVEEEEELYRKVKEKKKIKKKKIKLEEEKDEQLEQSEMELGEKTELIEESNEKEKRKNKKKKHKHKSEEDEQRQQQDEGMELDEKLQLMEESNEKEKRKKKKNKEIKIVEEEEHQQQQLQQQEIELEEKTQSIEQIPFKAVEEEMEEEEEEEVIVEEVNARVEVIGKNEDKFAPVVCYYSSGFNPERLRKKKNAGGEEEDDDGIEVKTVRTETRVEVVVTPKDYKVDFVGESHSGEPAASHGCYYSIAVFDKESQTLQIIPVAANKILRLEPKFRTSSVCDKEPLEGLKEEEQSPAKMALARRRLTSVYGTKNANKLATQMDILNRPEDAETQKSIDEKTQKIKLNTKALATASGAPSRNIPPHDPTADTPEMAYPIDRIILPGEWDSLRDILELVQSEADIAPNYYPSFVCNRVHNLLKIQDEKERMKLARIFSYITHLIKYKDQKSVDRHSSSRDHWIPTILKNKFVSMFSDSDKFAPEKINLLISYVLVLTLIADGYQTDMVDIAKDLRMTVAELREHYINLGCKPRKVNKVIVFTLPTPLDLPKPKMQRLKRKR